MTDIEKKALALVNEVETERGYPVTVKYAREEFSTIEALCRAIEQHEAFRQEVSDAVEKFKASGTWDNWDDVARFIIAKPDPLVEVIRDTGLFTGYADNLRAALAARGLEIREKQP